MSVVYLNGEYLHRDEAHVSVNDRGFVFADGIYEVTPAYNGRLFHFEHHLARLRKGLAAIGIDHDAALIEEVKQGLLARNGLDEVPVAYVYVQVTRGVAPRSHAFPDPAVPPTLYGFANQYHRASMDVWQQGTKAITIPDQRWARADIKAIALLPNVLAQQAAVDAGVSNTIFVRDGIALEGSHNNMFAVFGGVVTTAPKSNYILHGVTRDFVIELARGAGSPGRGTGHSAQRALPRRRGVLHGNDHRSQAGCRGRRKNDRRRQGWPGGASALREVPGGYRKLI